MRLGRTAELPWAMLGVLVGTLVRVLSFTWRVTLIGRVPDTAGPLVFAFWHGQQLCFVGAPRRRTTWVLVSHSRDGAVQRGAMTALGLRVARGSSSRGGATGLRSLVRALQQGHDVALAVDGPRGPCGEAKPGALDAARLGQARVIPVGAHAQRAAILGKAWDRFQIPLPFTRILVVLGERIPSGASATELTRELHSLTKEAASYGGAP